MLVEEGTLASNIPKKTVANLLDKYSVRHTYLVRNSICQVGVSKTHPNVVLVTRQIRWSAWKRSLEI